jgi:septum formation protein
MAIRNAAMLLLASASPARRRLLEQASIPHQVRVSGVEEEAITDPDPSRLVRRLAQAKASAVREGLTTADGEIRGVLGCDSLLVVGGDVFGKPGDSAEASRRWRRMAGGWGDLLTGHCLLAGPAASPAGGDGGPREWLAVITTRVRFAALEEEEIEAYVASGEPLQCAGGFALEGRGGLLVESVEGCVSNVIGLSLPLLRRWLRELG